MSAAGLWKTSSVDALNRNNNTSLAGTKPGNRLLSSSQSSVNSSRGELTSYGSVDGSSSPRLATAPPKAKIPSWYRNLHLSLMSMDSSDDDDDEGEKGEDEEDINVKLTRSRRTFSVDVGINLEHNQSTGKQKAIMIEQHRYVHLYYSCYSNLLPESAASSSVYHRGCYCLHLV